MRYLVLSTSLDPASKSRKLAHMAQLHLSAGAHEVTLLDLAQEPLPAFDNDTIYEDPRFQAHYKAVQNAQAIIIASPVYNWGLCGALKSFIEATGSTNETRKSAWFDKVVSFVCAGGVNHGYLSYTHAANALMIDFKCIINPYMAFAEGADWEGDRLNDMRMTRLEKTLDVHVELAEALSTRSYRSDWEI